MVLGKIVCLGKTYAKHAAEMASEVPAEPMFFLKPASSFLPSGGTVRLPPRSKRVEHEVELGVVIGRISRAHPEARWREAVLGYNVLIDVTARDLQAEAKKRGEPWALSKGFDTFCTMSDFVPAARVPDPHALGLELSVNGTVRQKASTGEMVHKIPRILEYLSSVMTLEPGDVVATGTPEGVGPLARGDRVEARLGDLATLHVDVA
ncbi:MAG: fumarylacetoacetate hydrolase family protein [Methanobacteriota archaeon]